MPEIIFNGNVKGQHVVKSTSFNASQKSTPVSKSETDMINDAMRIGYLIYPSRDIIWKSYRKQNTEEARLFELKLNKSASITDTHSQRRGSRFSAKTNSTKQLKLEYDLALVKLLNLSHYHLSEIGDIGACRNIRILNLSGNYITKIDSLKYCVQLLRLDLHNNQLKNLPDAYFWSHFNKLRILYLHNNPIGKLENVKKMAACPHLEILTLFDTPLSLKKNYRHLVVNLVFSLKALDNRIVSDEEIIEEAKFTDRFAASNKIFIKNLILPKMDSNSSYEDELKLTYKLQSEINKILAHHSPVHIIQRFLRGCMDRHYAKLRRISILWATTVIQRWWRHVKKKRYIPPRPEILKTQSSKSTATNDIKSASFYSSSSSSMANDKNARKHKILIDLNNLKMKTESLENLVSSESNLISESIMRRNHLNKRSKSEFDLYKQLLNDSKQKTNISLQIQTHINKQNSELSSLLKKLNEKVKFTNKPEKDVLDTSQQQIIVDRTLNTSEIEREKLDLDLDKKYLDERLYIKDEPRKHKRPHRLPPLAQKAQINERITYVHDLVHEKKFYSENINLLQTDIHDRLVKMNKIEPLKHKQIKTIDQKFFQKVYGNMSFGCLKAVDRAYSERNKAEVEKAKFTQVQRQRENHDFMKKNVQFFREERLREVQKIRESDKVQLEVTKRRLDLDKIQNIENVQELKSKTKEFTLNRRKDILLAVDFNKQHLSVSKALQKHEYDLYRDDSLKQNITTVNKLRTKSFKQHDIIKRFINLRNLKRIVDNKQDMQRVHSHLAFTNNYRLFISKHRVALVNASKNALSKINALTSQSTSMMNNSNENLTSLSKSNSAIQQQPAVAFKSMKSYLDKLKNLQFDDMDTNSSILIDNQA